MTELPSKGRPVQREIFYPSASGSQLAYWRDLLKHEGASVAVSKHATSDMISPKRLSPGTPERTKSNAKTTIVPPLGCGAAREF